jgi:hypothetical protein
MKAVYGCMSSAARAGLGFALVLTVLVGPALAGGGGPSVAPEIDPGSMGSALTLLIGGAFLLNARSRKG